MTLLGLVETLVAANQVILVAALALSFIVFGFLCLILIGAASQAKSSKKQDFYDLEDDALMNVCQVSPWIM